MIPKTIELNADSDFIKWDCRFEIGIPIIDGQHKHFVELCNNLYVTLMKKDMEEKLWKNAVERALHECVDYVKEHFSNEEKIMKAVSYPEYDTHIKKHEEFSRKVLETASRFSELDVSSALKFTKFLYDWILAHIAHEDKLYVPLVAKYLSQKKI